MSLRADAKVRTCMPISRKLSFRPRKRWKYLQAPKQASEQGCCAPGPSAASTADAGQGMPTLQIAIAPTGGRRQSKASCGANGRTLVSQGPHIACGTCRRHAPNCPCDAELAEVAAPCSNACARCSGSLAYRYGAHRCKTCLHAAVPAGGGGPAVSGAAHHFLTTGPVLCA